MAIFGGDKAEWWYCVTPQLPEECSRSNSSRFFAVPRGFLRVAVDKLLLALSPTTSYFRSKFLSPPSLSLSFAWQTFDFIFAWGYFQARSVSREYHTCHLYNQRRVRVHYDDRERTRVRWTDRTDGENTAWEEEKRNLFLRPWRRRFVSSWPYLLLVLFRRTLERPSKWEKGNKKTELKRNPRAIKRAKTHRHTCEFYRDQPSCSIFVINFTMAH